MLKIIRFLLSHRRQVTRRKEATNWSLTNRVGSRRTGCPSVPYSDRALFLRSLTISVTGPTQHNVHLVLFSVNIFTQILLLYPNWPCKLICCGHYKRCCYAKVFLFNKPVFGGKLLFTVMICYIFFQAIICINFFSSSYSDNRLKVNILISFLTITYKYLTKKQQRDYFSLYNLFCVL